MYQYDLKKKSKALKVRRSKSAPQAVRTFDRLLPNWLAEALTYEENAGENFRQQDKSHQGDATVMIIITTLRIAEERSRKQKTS